jgi:hypothetical protein
MTKYTVRSCCNCGIRKPQPEMKKVSIYTETGKSKAGVSASTFAGVFFGDKKSANSVNRWFFNTNQRTYKRKRDVWACSSCEAKVKAQSDPGSVIAGIFVILFVLFMIFFGSG